MKTKWYRFRGLEGLTLSFLLDYTEGIKAQAGRFHSLFLESKLTCLGFVLLKK